MSDSGELRVYVATWRTRHNDPEDGPSIMLHPDQATAEAHGSSAEPLPAPLWDFVDWPPEVSCRRCGDYLLPVAAGVQAPKLTCPSCDAQVEL